MRRACETVERVLPDINARDYDVDEDIAKVSLVGTGMKSSPGVAARAFQTLGENQIKHSCHLHVTHPAVGGGGQRADRSGRALPAHGVRPGQRQRVRGDAAFRRGDSREDEQGTLTFRWPAAGGTGRRCEGLAHAAFAGSQRLAYRKYASPS